MIKIGTSEVNRIVFDREDYDRMYYGMHQVWPSDQPGANVIFYTTTDGSILDIPVSASYQRFGANKTGEHYSSTWGGYINFDGPVTKFDMQAFAYKNLISITIPNTVTFLGSGAFTHCEALTSIIIPSGVTSIDQQAFYACYNLEEVTFAGTRAVLSNGVFQFCRALTDVKIPSANTSIPQALFQGCSSLTGVTIPSSIRTIDDYAFEDCEALVSLTLPTSLRTIGRYAFENCYMPLTIPAGVTTLKDYAFANWQGPSITFAGNNITELPEGCFSGATQVSVVTVPSSVTSIQRGVWYNCLSLHQIVCTSSASPTLSSVGIFDENTGIAVGTGTIKVPRGKQSAYSAWVQNVEHYPGYYGWSITT
jgi:hypothetical protein